MLQLQFALSLSIIMTRDFVENSLCLTLSHSHNCLIILSMDFWRRLFVGFYFVYFLFVFSSGTLLSHVGVSHRQDLDKTQSGIMRHHSSISELKRSFMESVPEPRPSEWDKRLSTHSPFRTAINGQMQPDVVSTMLKQFIYKI